MLLEFSCSNFKSIQEPITLSFVAKKDDTYHEDLVSWQKEQFLKAMVLFGPNGSGKSNVIQAIKYMRDLVVYNVLYQPGDAIRQYPHKLYDNQTPSVFALSFVKQEVRYAYQFSIQNQCVLEESLLYYPKGRQVKIFERKGKEVKPGDRYRSTFDSNIKALRENRLLLSCIANDMNIEEVELAFRFFKEDLVLFEEEENQFDHSMRMLQENQAMKEQFLSVVTRLDTGIKDITQVMVGTRSFVTLKYEHYETDLLQEESEGIQRLFALLVPLIDALQQGKVLICDDLEKHLHETIVYEVLSFFQKAQKQPTAQLLCTSHHTGILTAKILRRDQVWFTQLNETRATILYRLSDVRNVRKTENLKNGYLLGKYGGIPKIKDEN